jgi:hypothetical protein
LLLLPGIPPRALQAGVDDEHYVHFPDVFPVNTVDLLFSFRSADPFGYGVNTLDNH